MFSKNLLFLIYLFLKIIILIDCKIRIDKITDLIAYRYKENFECDYWKNKDTTWWLYDILYCYVFHPFETLLTIGALNIAMLLTLPSL